MWPCIMVICYFLGQIKVSVTWPICDFWTFLVLLFTILLSCVKEKNARFVSDYAMWRHLSQSVCHSRLSDKIHVWWLDPVWQITVGLVEWERSYHSFSYPISVSNSMKFFYKCQLHRTPRLFSPETPLKHAHECLPLLKQYSITSKRYSRTILSSLFLSHCYYTQCQ